jgi:hypothetical protein
VIPWSDGQCGPTNGPQCPDCKGMTVEGMAAAAAVLQSASASSSSGSTSSAAQVTHCGTKQTQCISNLGCSFV